MAVSEYKNASFEVVAPGMMTTVQDGGRVGFQQYGMPWPVLWMVKAMLSDKPL